MRNHHALQIPSEKQCKFMFIWPQKPIHLSVFFLLSADLTYTLHIRRRTFFYVFNIIVPCVMLSVLTLLTFWLPTTSGNVIRANSTNVLTADKVRYNITPTADFKIQGNLRNIPDQTEIWGGGGRWGRYPDQVTLLPTDRSPS